MSELNEADKSLGRVRDLLLAASQQAANRGEWDKAKDMMAWAERSDQLRAEIAGGGHATHTDEGREKELEPVAAGDGTESEDARYPRYFLRDGSLVKQGQQRASGGVYEHMVPRDRYDQILEPLIATARSKKRTFSISYIQKSLDCPLYMIYAVVAMLVRQGLLYRARKGAYAFKAAETFEKDAVNIWDTLGGNAS